MGFSPLISDATSHQLRNVRFICMITTQTTTATPELSAMQTAFDSSDARWDGRFVAAVGTTGIYCRPSCRVRKPLAKNVTFLPDATAARTAGYRACLRCHPDQAQEVAMRTIDTPIGPMLGGASPNAIVLLDFADRPMITAQLAAVRRRIGPTSVHESPLLDRVEQQLAEYFAGTRREFDVPLDAPGSPFQERVWSELARIPYGETISYRELAERAETPNAFRAVGRANGSNRVAVVIPCHRVIAANGGLGGYGGGLAAKAALLALERGAGMAHRAMPAP